MEEAGLQYLTAIVTHPMSLTWLLTGIYALNSLQFLIRGNFTGAGYWACALGITVCAMQGFNR
jgi:hypothetical protein